MEFHPGRKQVLSVAILCGLMLGGCGGYAGSRLVVGHASAADVLAEMGQPAMRWKDDDGSEQLAYPRGPAGTHSYMAFIGPEGRLQRLENVMDVPHFARIRPGKSDQAEVLRLIGPPVADWTAYFEARDELVWEWIFCDDTNLLARFDVLFDNTTGIVRTTLQRQDLRGSAMVAPYCSH